MAVQNASVSVSTTAVLLSGTTDLSDQYDLRGQSVLLNSPSVIYVGPAGVTSGTGYAITPGVEYAFDLGPGDALYGITASGTVVVPVLRTGV